MGTRHTALRTVRVRLLTDPREHKTGFDVRTRECFTTDYLTMCGAEVNACDIGISDYEANCLACHKVVKKYDGGKR